MTTHVGTCDISAQDVSAVLEGVSWPADAWSWTRGLEGVRLGTALAAKELAKAPQGRVFWPKGEVKWQALENGVRVVYLGEAKLAEGRFSMKEFASGTAEDRRFKLHGEAVAEGLREADDGAVIVVEVREYRFEGYGRFERLVRISADSPQSFDQKS